MKQALQVTGTANHVATLQPICGCRAFRGLRSLVDAGTAHWVDRCVPTSLHTVLGEVEACSHTHPLLLLPFVPVMMCLAEAIQQSCRQHGRL